MKRAATIPHNRASVTRLALLRFAFCCAIPTAAIPQAGAQQGPASDIQTSIHFLKSPEPSLRSTAAKSLVSNWKDSVPALLPELETYDPDTLKRELTAEEKKNFLSMTDVLRTIVLNNNEAVKPFRTNQNEKTTRALTWAASSNDKDLRLNATYILGSVTDNSTVCIVLDSLRDPNINVNGLANLAQVATAVSSYAYDYNIDAIRETKQIVDANMSKISFDNATRKLLEDLVPAADGSIFKHASGPDSRCKNYAYKKKPTG